MNTAGVSRGSKLLDRAIVHTLPETPAGDTVAHALCILWSRSDCNPPHAA
jgi:hypothetical protein